MSRRCMFAFLLACAGAPALAAPILVCGDCNADGAVGVLDAFAAARHDIGLATLAGMDFVRCNVAGVPGGVGRAGVTVDTLDTLALAQTAVGLAGVPACGVLDIADGVIHLTGTSGAGAGVLEDWDGDGDLDLYLGVSTISSTAFAVMENDGAGRFTPGIVAPPPGIGWDVVAWDWDGDGHKEGVFGAADQVYVYKRRTATALDLVETFLVQGSGIGSLSVGDINDDGVDDLIVALLDPLLGFRAIISDGLGGWRMTGSFLSASGNAGVAVADMTGEGCGDALVPLLAIQVIEIWQGCSADDLTVSGSISTSQPVRGIRVEDVDRDGSEDIVGFAILPSALQVYWGPTFAPPDDFALPGVATHLRLADLTGNGWLDVVANSGFSNDLTILEHTGARTFTLTTLVPSWWAGTGLDVGDIDGDGDADLVGTNAGVVIVYENLLIP